LTLLASSVTATNSLDYVLRGEIDSLVLRNPTFTFRIGNGPAGTADLSFLAKLPSVRRLEIQNGEAHLMFEAEHQQVKLDNMNITIKDFSSKGGGSVSFQSSFAFERSGGATFAARGKITGDLQLAGLDPRPHGRGTIELSVESGTYTRDNRTVSLDSLVVATDLAYDQRPNTLTINRLHGESKSLGSIQGNARAVLRDDMPWSANLSVASIDFAKLVGVLKPFLPEEYRTWTMQGEGAVETQVRGTLANEQPSLDGTMTFSFTQGGFSSPDSTKAAQGISARLVLGLAYVAAERKLAFTVRGEQRDGEYLWGTYYSNLGGRVASLTTDGAFFFGGDGRFALNGLVDVFQTGDYSFNASGTDRNWGIQFKADVSHARLVETLLREYFKGLSPDLGNLSLTGTSSLEATVRREDEATVITGMYRMAGAALNAPDMQLSVQEIAANVPFDLTYPPSARASPSREPGFLRLQTFQRRRLSIDQFEVPLVIAHNRLEVPEPVQVPFFGGRIHLYGIQVDDVLFPTHYRFGVKIDDVDLGRMTRRLAGVEYPGRINADFGMMRYANSRVTSEGKAVVGIFGGEIEARNLFAEELASASRRFGGDLTFRNISLEELTRKIEVGKITGVIQGSLRNFAMEFGEPASFILEIESVRARGVDQSISTDAIESISILGTGAGSALNRGITQFFKEYPYSKIGLRCVLKNDQFSVNGTIHDGGKEYLVRRGVLRGVDVINQNPDNVISFRDMEERIKRIFHTSQPEMDAIKVE